jgi:hypothetical protein
MKLFWIALFLFFVFWRGTHNIWNGLIVIGIYILGCIVYNVVNR